MAVVGIVSAVSKDCTGIKVEGTWYNYSKFSEFPEKPQIGDKVKLILDGNGKWIKEIQILEKSTSPITPNQDRDLRISKLAVLNTAVEILKTHNVAITTDDVIATAEELLEWVINSSEPASDNTSQDSISEEEIVDVPF
jgi:hypothetical protein